MCSFHDLPFKRKLTLISLLTSGLALLLACGAFIAYEQFSFRRNLIRELEITAHIIAANSASSLSFDDNDSAALTLKSLQEQPHLVRACVYDKNGKVFASYRRDPGDDSPWPAPREEIARFGDDHVEFFHEIRSAGDYSGALYLQSDLHELRERQSRYLAIAGAVLAAALLVTWLIASRLQRLVSEPISQLADIVGRIRAERAYSIRAVKRGDDELGRLVDGFNEMLVQIEARDAELHAAHKELERRVEERTRSLEDARKEIAVEKARFQFIFDHAPVGLSHHSRNGGVTHARLINDAHLHICGLRREQLGDFSIFEKITHPEDRLRQERLWAQIQSGEIDRFSLEKRYLRPDGGTAWVVFSVQRRAYPDGRIEELATISDITELKRAQLGIEQERERFKFIFDSLPVGVSLLSQVPGGAPPVFLINDSQLRIAGVTREAVLAERGIFNRLTHPEDYPLQLPLREKFRAGEVDRYSIEKRYVRPDGEIVAVAFHTQRKTYPDGRTETLSVVVDITALKLAQEEIARERARFKFILEALPVGVSWRLLDLESKLVVNPAHERITGIPASESGDLYAFARVTHPDDLERQNALVAKLNRGEIDHFSLEKRYLHPDGRVVWAMLLSRVSTDPDTGKGQSVTTLVDITERKHAEAELDELHKQLLRTSHQAGMAEVATGVLHNVGNVLNSVNVSATLVTDLVRRSKAPNVAKVCALLDQHRADLGRYLSEDPKGRMIPAYLATLAESLASEQKTIVAELGALSKNIDHIKDIVAMQQSYAKTSGVTETISVPDLVEDAIRMNAGSLARHDVDVVREYDGRPVITVEKNKVLQILVNLIRNAKYACDESGRTDKRLVIRTRVDPAGVDIAVIDNGVGIPPENLTRIFAHGFTTRKHGHGFGLHSGALAAKELGGSLTAHSEGPGKGATFALRLPSKPVDQSA